MMLQARPSAWGRIIKFQYDTARPQTRPSKTDRSPIAPQCGYGSTGAADGDRVSGCAVSDSLPSFETPCCARLLRMRSVIAEFARAHEAWAAPIVGALAFGESLAFISLVIPAWAILVALGTLIGKSGLDFWPIWVGGAVGAALGDWLSYWVGVKLGPAVAHMWPL